MNYEEFMSERRKRLLTISAVLIITLSFLLIVAAKSGASSLYALPVNTSAIKGGWTASTYKNAPDEIQISFNRHIEGDTGYNNVIGNSFKFSELQGLSATDAGSPARTNVNFSLVREAGTIACEGYFQAGSGAGLWTFTPNPAFTSSMRSRG
jgi:hypothetical protein